MSTTQTERELTLSDLTTRYIKYVQEVSDLFNRKLIICIDELDKIEDPEQVKKILLQIKGALFVKNTFYLISISEDASKAFQNRLSSGRDIFESTFDELIFLNRLNSNQGLEIIKKRSSLALAESSLKELTKYSLPVGLIPQLKKSKNGYLRTSVDLINDIRQKILISPKLEEFIISLMVNEKEVRVTDELIQQIESEFIPERVITKLKDALVDKEFSAEADFIYALSSLLKPSELDKFQEKLISFTNKRLYVGQQESEEDNVFEAPTGDSWEAKMKSNTAVITLFAGGVPREMIRITREVLLKYDQFSEPTQFEIAHYLFEKKIEDLIADLGEITMDGIRSLQIHSKLSESQSQLNGLTTNIKSNIDKLILQFEECIKILDEKDLHNTVSYVPDDKMKEEYLGIKEGVRRFTEVIILAQILILLNEKVTESSEKFVEVEKKILYSFKVLENNPALAKSIIKLDNVA